MNEHWTHIPGFIKTLTPGVRCTFEQSQALPIFGNYIRKWRNPRQPVLAGQKPWAVSAHSLSDQINHGLLGDSVKGVVLGPDDHSNRGGLVGREGGFSCGLARCSGDLYCIKALGGRESRCSGGW